MKTKTGAVLRAVFVGLCALTVGAAWAREQYVLAIIVALAGIATSVSVFYQWFKHEFGD